MSQIVNIGVAGCGYWGPNLARNFDSLANCRLKAVCDSSAERLRHMESLYPGIRAYRDYYDFLQNGEIDAVAVATGVAQHYSMGKASLLAKKHTCIEKPMATSSGECKELDRISRGLDLILMAGHTYLYSPVVREIKRIVADGQIGDIRYISARRLNLGLFQKDINVTWDLAPHDLSIILYIMDALPERVNCQGSANVTAGIHDVSTLWLGFSNNRSATIQSSWLDPRKTREMTIVGSKKMIIYDDLENQDKVRICDARVEAPGHYDSFAEFHYSYHYGDTVIPYVKQEEPLKIECQHFVDCILNRRQPITNSDHALKVVRILEAASASLKSNGAPVDLAGHDDSSILATRRPALRNGVAGSFIGRSPIVAPHANGSTAQVAGIVPRKRSPKNVGTGSK